MKILRMFDSLKFVRAMFVAVACAFFIFPAHAELQDTELPVGYKRLTGISYDSNTYYETNEKLYGSDTLTIRLSNTKTAGQNVIGAYSGTGDDARNFSLYIYGNGSTSNSYLRHGTKLGRPRYGAGTRTLVMGPSGTDGFLNDATYVEEDFETTDTFWIGGLPNSSSTKFDGNIVGNVTVSNRLKYIPCERVSDGEIGYYETFTGTFLENQGNGTPVSMGYDTSHMVEVPIKIATTHYNETKFAPVKTDLSAAMDAVDDVVTRTMTQAQAIDTIATSKQTRPDEGCDAKYCLLVEDEQGVPHWYPIAGANGVAHNLPAGYTELQYIESMGTQYIDTGLKGTQDTKVVLDFQLSDYNDKGYILGSRTSQNTNAFLIGSNDGRFNSSGNSFPFAQFDSVSPTVVQQGPKFDLNRHVYELSSGGFYIDGGLYTTYSNPTNFSTPENITLFGRYSAGAFAYGIFRAYGLKLYNGNNLVRDLIPARNSSGVVGMYDMVSGQFFTNQGIGTFTAGPEM